MPHPDCAQVPMVLCNASYYGTVAAIRSLGRAGIPVVAVTPGCLAPDDALVMRNPTSALRLSTPPIGLTGFWRWAEMGFVGQFTLQAMPFPSRLPIDGKS